MITFQVTPSCDKIAVFTKYNGNTIAVDHFKTADEVIAAKQGLKNRAINLLEQCNKAKEILNND